MPAARSVVVDFWALPRISSQRSIASRSGDILGLGSPGCRRNNTEATPRRRRPVPTSSPWACSWIFSSTACRCPRTPRHDRTRLRRPRPTRASLRSGIRKPLRSVLHRCLAADPARRFADGDALADALDRVAAATDPVVRADAARAPRPSSSGRRRAMLAAGALLDSASASRLRCRRRSSTSTL
jgi:hypothetical protein